MICVWNGSRSVLRRAAISSVRTTSLPSHTGISSSRILRSIRLAIVASVSPAELLSAQPAKSGRFKSCADSNRPIYTPELAISSLSGQFGGVVLSARLAFCACTTRVLTQFCGLCRRGVWVVQTGNATCADGIRCRNACCADYRANVLRIHATASCVQICMLGSMPLTPCHAVSAVPNDSP